MTFGEKLYQLRKERGLSQEALAEKLHTSRQAISKWENYFNQQNISDNTGRSADGRAGDGDGAQW